MSIHIPTLTFMFRVPGRTRISSVCNTTAYCEAIDTEKLDFSSTFVLHMLPNNTSSNFNFAGLDKIISSPVEVVNFLSKPLAL